MIFKIIIICLSIIFFIFLILLLISYIRIKKVQKQFKKDFRPIIKSLEKSTGKKITESEVGMRIGGGKERKYTIKWDE